MEKSEIAKMAAALISDVVKPPPIPAEARRALTEASVQMERIRLELEGLSEAALKGLVYEIRENNGDDPLMLGVAAAADRKREILRRYRTGRGEWFAIVEACEWEDPFRNRGESRILAQAKCASRPAAVAEASRLLVEHAGKFSERTSIEARVLCDLEMSEEDTE
jgi:hypothetical protein